MSVTIPEDPLDLYGAPCAILDFETTWDGDAVPGEWAGRFHMEAHRPVECAVLHGRVGFPDFEVVVDRRYRPPQPVNPEATAIHGITDADLEDCDPFDSDAVNEILEAIDGRILVAYNLPFDWSVLCDHCLELGLDPVPFAGIDPLILARVIETPFHSCALSRVTRRRGRVLWAHGAKADCEATLWYMNVAIRSLLRRELWELDDVENFAAIWNSQVVTAIAWERRAAPRDTRFSLYWTELMGDRGI